MWLQKNNDCLRHRAMQARHGPGACYALAANEFFSHKKKLILATLFYRKRACSNAVTMDNAKMFPQLMSTAEACLK